MLSGTVRYSAAALAELASGEFSIVEQELERHFVAQGLGAPALPERRSWRNSLPVLARDLHDAGLGDVEVLLEYRLPLSSKRADVVLAGVHPTSGDPSYVVVELKQWSRARMSADSDTLVEIDGARYQQGIHPSIQVADYVDYMLDFTKSLESDTDRITGLAYLHNAADGGIEDLTVAAAVDRAPLFTSNQRGALHAHLRSRLAPSDGKAAADLLLGSAVGPSKQLLTVAAAEIRDREQFKLLDEQRVAHDIVLRAVKRAQRSNTKTAVVITGGPGSGKSVIALSLLGQLAREGREVLHATGSQSFTQTMRKVAGRGSTRTQSLFKYFNSFIDAETNGLDVLILDEAHRIREKSVNRYTKKEIRDRARPQIDELLAAARVPVFLLDEHQVVRSGENGTIESIRTRATELGMEVEQIDLNAQFRAGGSDAYIEWVLRLLDLKPGGPIPWAGDEHFGVDVVDSPEELESRLAAHRLNGYGARMTAGYCWRWSDPVDGALVSDVKIGEWSRPWNVKGDRRVGEAPPAPLWASDPHGFDQVGCVYTAQGFEYDWNGVILGPDLVWRTDRWESRRDSNKDPDFKSRKNVSDGDFDRLVRNVYKVLLTRGMVGTLIYSVDPETRQKLAELVHR
ncbi:ATP-binding protein [Oerskovia sp. Root918]|uniref:DUF2075 domain-containing protein n=1 Tax=Oerskovia sp. Root918 TaxID=1736607 RepID=UPI000700AE40|nr:DUF2075 domain-containing protein [Oerskovia sp. Root918]KRD35830.1 ATP-binding protein [Oerskovia sp. Root918]